MKTLLERVKVAGWVALAACCLAFFAVADDDGNDGAQVETTANSSSCSATCEDKYEMCIAGGGSLGDCTANYNNCTGNCSDDVDD